MAVGEWDQRQLCSDGACIGVIGADGTCKVCGRAAPNWGDERNRGLIDPPDDEDEDEDDDEDLAADGGDEDDDDGDDDDDDDDDDDGDDEGDEDDGDDEPPGPEIAAAPRGEWSARRLCPDGACIGVIGPDGRCKVCGRRASDAPAELAGDTPAELAGDTPAAPAGDTPAKLAGDAPAEPASEPAAAPPAPAPGEPAAVAATETATASAQPAPPGAVATDHEPCPTPGCGGRVGSDGRCAACGKGAS